MASRWNTTVEGAIEKEKDILTDRTIYDELRERRDFGLEQVIQPWYFDTQLSESSTRRTDHELPEHILFIVY